MTDRKSGKFGAKPTAIKPEIYLDKFRTAVTPHPAMWDGTGGLRNIDMLGNDVYGDCVVAATEHGRMFKALVSNNPPKWVAGFRPPHTPYTESLYFSFGKSQGEPGPRPDQGCDPGAWMHWYWNKQLDKAYAQVDVSDPSTKLENLKQAAFEFGGVLTCVQLTSTCETLFEQHQPWGTDGDLTPDPSMGHGIYLDAYTPDDVSFATWGYADQLATNAWVEACVTSAFVFLDREDAIRLGVNFDALLTVLQGMESPVGEDYPVYPARGVLGGIENDVRQVIQGAEQWTEHEAKRLKGLWKLLHKAMGQAIEREATDLILEGLRVGIKEL